MKRSEMLLNIASEISAEYHTAFDLAQNMAEVILTRIEKAGMMPPPVWKEVGYIRSTGDYGYEVSKWEPENE